MNKFLAMYKCQLCGKTYHHSYLAGTTEEVEDLLAKTILHQEKFGFQPDIHKLPERLPHKCKDGSLGVAVFIGFEKFQ